MQINEIICNLLSSLEYDVFYIFKPDGIELDTYITFDTSIQNSWFSNDGHEANTFMIVVNILTKDIKQISNIINQIIEIVDTNQNCYNFLNRGNSYIKDTGEYFSACTFNMIYIN